MLEPALEQDETWAEVERRIADHTAQLWWGDGCAMLTEVVDKCIHVWLGGGSLKGLLEMRPRIEFLAKVNGCEEATINGRLGWDRLLKPFGYTRVGNELRKTL